MEMKRLQNHYQLKCVILSILFFILGWKTSRARITEASGEGIRALSQDGDLFIFIDPISLILVLWDFASG